MDFDVNDLDHDRISQEVRIRLAARLEKLMELLEDQLEPSGLNMGEVSPAMVQAYLSAVKLLGGMYQVQQRPDADSVPAARVARMVQEAEQRAAELAVEQFRQVRELEGRREFEDARAALLVQLAKADSGSDDVSSGGDLLDPEAG
jgi:hypothetical protein